MVWFGGIGRSIHCLCRSIWWNSCWKPSEHVFLRRAGRWRLTGDFEVQPLLLCLLARKYCNIFENQESFSRPSSRIHHSRVRSRIALDKFQACNRFIVTAFWPTQLRLGLFAVENKIFPGRTTPSIYPFRKSFGLLGADPTQHSSLNRGRESIEILDIYQEDHLFHLLASRISWLGHCAGLWSSKAQTW